MLVHNVEAPEAGERWLLFGWARKKLHVGDIGVTVCQKSLTSLFVFFHCGGFVWGISVSSCSLVIAYSRGLCVVFVARQHGERL